MTWRDYVCNKCHHKVRSGNLFNALKNFHTGTPKCQECEGATQLLLQFDFGKGVGRTQCTVLDVFLPARSTKWNGVVFYPFQVVLKRGRTTAYWLPYWHVEGGKKYYGQWAPFIHERMFKDLLSQAQKMGYLRSRAVSFR